MPDIILNAVHIVCIQASTFVCLNSYVNMSICQHVNMSTMIQQLRSNCRNSFKM